MAYDVTAHVESRQQPEQHRTELERLFAQAPVAIASLRGPTLLVELANAAVAHIWGRTRPRWWAARTSRPCRRRPSRALSKS